MNSRLPRWVILVGALFAAQLVWWGVLLWRQSGTNHDLGYQLLQQRRGLAERAWRGEIAAGRAPQEAWNAIADGFPDVVFVPGAEPELQPSGTAVSALARDRGGFRAMVLGEGAFFLVLSSLALALVLRAARHEQRLALQESNFVHAVTHEFRSPLQSLRLAVETLLRRPDPARARSYGEGMLEDIARLDGMVVNLLEVGRIEARGLDARPHRVDLSAAVEAELDRWVRSLPAEAAAIERRIEPGLLAEADPVALRPILHNLLDNARKYGEGAPIVLGLSREGAYVTLSVRDAGRGFSAADRPRLFERFWRAGDERVRTAPGVGLGLYLVAELARAQGATVDAESAGPGTGATFSVSWPAAEAR